MAVWAQTYFLNSNSIILFFLIEYHNLAIFLITNICVFLLAIIIQLLGGNYFHCCPWKKDNKVLEILWTIFPAYWLIILAVPSLGNLYRIDLRKTQYDILFKAIGNQWYWRYEYRIRGLGTDLGSANLINLETDRDILECGSYRLISYDQMGGRWVKDKDEGQVSKFMEHFNNLIYRKYQKDDMSNFRIKSFLGPYAEGFSYKGGVKFVSYMEDIRGLNSGDYRLLEVDNRAVCPGLANVRVNITSEDVIHSWTVPSLGIKVDAVPGRLNCATFNSLSYGVFYGQCSEMCGAKHSFMPICLEVIPFNWFRLWYGEFQVGL